LRESIEMGTFTGTSSTIDKIISEMRSDYQGTDYHVLNRNCNAFADDFLQRLLGVPAPGFVNRMAFIGSFFSCLLPENLNQDPTQQQNQGSSSGSSYNTGTTGRSSGGVYRTARTSTPAPKMVSGTSGVKLGKYLYIILCIISCWYKTLDLSVRLVIETSNLLKSMFFLNLC